MTSPEAAICAYAYGSWLAGQDGHPRCLPLLLFGGGAQVWGWKKNWHREDVCTPMCEHGPTAYRRADRTPTTVPPATTTTKATANAHWMTGGRLARAPTRVRARVDNAAPPRATFWGTRPVAATSASPPLGSPGGWP